MRIFRRHYQNNIDIKSINIYMCIICICVFTGKYGFVVLYFGLYTKSQSTIKTNLLELFDALCSGGQFCYLYVDNTHIIHWKYR